MRSAEFFIKKAESYIDSIRNLEDNFVDYHFSGNGIESVYRQESEYSKQQEKISDLKLKIKLMFAEFEHGHLFSKRIDKVEASPFGALADKSNLPFYRELLSIFIEHIDEYRLNTVVV